MRSFVSTDIWSTRSIVSIRSILPAISSTDEDLVNRIRELSELNSEQAMPCHRIGIHALLLVLDRELRRGRPAFTKIQLA
jgi:hypothetical protein